MRVAFPLVLYDHDGFASDGLDAEPTIEFPEQVRYEHDDWFETVRGAGPPLYGTAIKMVKVARHS
jgi:hypothetical protein